jgi:hypothetical protein
MAESNVPPLVQAARDFMQRLKDIHVPAGEPFDALSAPLRAKPGPRTALAAVAEFIDLRQELAAIDANKKLLERLRGKDGHNIIDDIGTLTFASQDELAAKEVLLREALTIRGKNAFEAMNLAVRNIARDKSIQLDRDDMLDPKKRILLSRALKRKNWMKVPGAIRCIRDRGPIFQMMRSAEVLRKQIRISARMSQPSENPPRAIRGTLFPAEMIKRNMSARKGLPLGLLSI